MEADYTLTNSNIEKRDYEQFVNSAETQEDLVSALLLRLLTSQIFPTAVLWFLITFFGFLLAYLVYYVIMVFVVHKGME